jgi:hypothetical protein
MRWILFLPISILISFTFGFIYKLFTIYLLPSSFIFEVLHPAIFQFFFLILIYFTVPNGKIKWVKGLIILRSTILLIYIFPILISLKNIYDSMGESFILRVINPNFYDLDLFKTLPGEILTLIVSIYLYKLLRE